MVLRLCTDCFPDRHFYILRPIGCASSAGPLHKKKVEFRELFASSRSSLDSASPEYRLLSGGIFLYFVAPNRVRIQIGRPVAPKKAEFRKLFASSRGILGSASPVYRLLSGTKLLCYAPHRCAHPDRKQPERSEGQNAPNNKRITTSRESRVFEFSGPAGPGGSPGLWDGRTGGSPGRTTDHQHTTARITCDGQYQRIRIQPAILSLAVQLVSVPSKQTFETLQFQT